MCKILYKKNNSVKFNQQELRSSYIGNPDGTGIIYFDRELGHNVIKKFNYKTDFKDIYDYVQKIENKPNIENVIIHFRLGTSGTKSLDNIHPIAVDKAKDKYIVHNGVIAAFDFGTKKSDTANLAQWMKENEFSIENDPKSMNSQLFKNLIEGNKVLLIEKDNVKVFNAGLGEERNGIWRSWKEYDDYGFYRGQNQWLKDLHSEILEKGEWIDYNKKDLIDEEKDINYGQANKKANW